MSFEEPRSFDPSPAARGALVKFDPMPEEPSQADTLRAVYQLHECVEDGRGVAVKHAEDDRRDHRNITRRMSRVEKQVAGIAAVVGVDKEGKRVRKTLLTMSQLELFSKISGFGFGVILLVQALNAVWPGVKAAALALWAFMLHGAH